MVRKVTVCYVSGNDSAHATVELTADYKREKTERAGKKSKECMERCRTFLESGIKPIGDYSIHIQDDTVNEMYPNGDTAGYFNFQLEEQCKANGWKLRK